MEFFTIKSFENKFIKPSGIEITKITKAFKYLSKIEDNSEKTIHCFEKNPIVFIENGFNINPQNNKKSLEDLISKKTIQNEDHIVSKALNWLDNGRVGLSSATMCATLFPELTNHHKFNNKKKTDGTVEINWPHDNSDFQRCLSFLEYVPEARKRIFELKKLNIQWANLIDNWDKIENFIKNEQTDESYQLIKYCILKNKKAFQH